MVTPNEYRYLRKKLLQWCEGNCRDYPWRDSGLSNYTIILTEVLLQRTNAEIVNSYFHTFFSTYSDWDSILRASNEDLEKILRPLGLYEHRRRRITSLLDFYVKNGSKIPQNEKELVKSPFNTLYLSNAIRLFIYKEKAPLIDVNMARLISRFLSLDAPRELRNNNELHRIAKRLVNVKHTIELNYAILDFSALVCQSRNPKCKKCILRRKCCFFNNL